MHCSSNTDDIRTGFEEIFKKYPKNPVYGMGLSLGSTLLGCVRTIFIIVYF